MPTYNYTYALDKGFYTNLSWVKFQRPAEPSHYKIFRDFKQKCPSIPLYIDIDDLVFDIPETNAASRYYKQREPYTKELFKIADGIVCSTEYLKRKLQKYNNKISVNSNYLVKAIFGKNTWKEKEYKKPRILYPGSFNHFSQKTSGGDFSNELINYIIKTLDIYEWHFIGGCPFELKNNSKIKLHKWCNYYEYSNKIKEINPTVAIAPLEDNEFNKCKSNIKLLEYCALGIPGLYQNLEPYNEASYKFSTIDEFIDKLENLIKDVNIQHDVWYNDYNLIKDKLYLEDNMLNWINAHLKLMNKVIK
jgi:hypothetical protein